MQRGFREEPDSTREVAVGPTFGMRASPNYLTIKTTRIRRILSYSKTRKILEALDSVDTEARPNRIFDLLIPRFAVVGRELLKTEGVQRYY